MKKIVYIAGGLTLLVLLLAIFWPIGSQVPALSPIQVTSDQGERALHLELGMLYEKGSEWERAQEEYGQAISAEADEISAAAKAGIERSFAKQHSPWLNIQQALRTFLAWIAENVLKLILLGMVVVLLWWCATRLPRRSGYVLLPFHSTVDEDLGRTLVTVLNQTIHQARQIHLQGQKGVFAAGENLTVPSFGTLDDGRDVVAESLKAVDSFTIGPINLPLGQFLSAIQCWVSVREYVISGSIETYANIVRLTAEIKQARTGTVVQVWDLSDKLEGDLVEQVIQMGAKLGYHILHYVCPQIEARSWSSLRLFSNALGTMHQYHSGLGDLAMLEKAVEDLEGCLSIDPGYLSARYNLGLAYSVLGKYDEAREIFQEIKECSSRFQIEAAYNLGLVYYHKFQDWAYDRAIGEFEEVLYQLADENNREEKATLKALAYCGLAGVYAQKIKRDPKKAEDYFSRVEQNFQEALALGVQVRDVQSAAHGAMGIAHANRNALQDAINAFTTSIYLKPDYPVNYVYLAEVHRRLGDNEATIEWLRRCIRYNPGYEYAYYRLGMAYKAAKETDLAMEAWHQAHRVADAHNELGKLLASQGRYEEALAEFRHALALNRRHSEVLCNLAWYLIEAGKTDDESLKQATEYAHRSVQLEQDTPYEWHRRDILGLVYLNRAMYDEARKQLRESIGRNGHQSQNRYHLALVYHTEGNFEKALETISELLEKIEDKGIWWEKAVALMQDLKREKQNES